MASKFTTVSEVETFFNECKNFWLRLGNSEAVATCKAFWYDLVEVSNEFDAWGPAKEQFAYDFAGYKPGDRMPDDTEIESGNCAPIKM